MAPDADDLEGCGHVDADDVVTDEDAPYVALFAEALDPNSDVTIEQAQADWAELFGASS